MKKNRNHPNRVIRLGSAQPQAQVRQAVCNVTLEGMQPTTFGVKLVQLVATGKLRTSEAVQRLNRHYGRRA